MDDYLIVIILILLGSVSAFFSGILSYASTEELNKRIEENDAKALRIEKIKEQFEIFFNAFFLIEMFLYSVAAILAGIFSIEVFSLYEDNWQYVIYATVAFFSFTIISRYFFSALGRRFANQTVYAFSGFLYILYALSKPFVKIIIFIDEKVGGKSGTDDSLEELDAIVETAHEDGAIDAGEYKIFKNLIHFSDIHASDVMTPRTVLFSCVADMTVADAVRLPELKMYSRFPVWEGESLDDGVVGYVMTKDILHAALTGGENKKLRELAREVYFIPENAELDEAMDQFIQRRQHLILVVDEYGGIEGLLTMEDALEALLGKEIVDEADKVVDLRILAKQRRDMRIASMNSKT